VNCIELICFEKVWCRKVTTGLGHVCYGAVGTGVVKVEGNVEFC